MKNQGNRGDPLRSGSSPGDHALRGHGGFGMGAEELVGWNCVVVRTHGAE